MRKINNWADYNKLVKEETYNVAKIEDTYIYQLESWNVIGNWRKEEIARFKKEMEQLREENKQLKKKIRDIVKSEYGHGGAHQMFFEELTEVNDILEETKDQSILLPRNLGGSDD